MFLTKNGFMTKPLRRSNFSGKLISLSEIALSEKKTGFKIKHRRDICLEIYFHEFMFFSRKPVLKLNLRNEIIRPAGLFIRLSLCFFAKNLFLELNLCAGIIGRGLISSSEFTFFAKNRF